MLNANTFYGTDREKPIMKTKTVILDWKYANV